VFGVTTRAPVPRARNRPGLPAWWVGVLAGLVLALLVVDDLPIVHDHDQPGVYNEECPLARLAAGGPRAALARSPDLILLLRVPEALPAIPQPVLAPFSLASFDPRAPPPVHRSLPAQ
jgi:hypothetical protein